MTKSHVTPTMFALSAMEHPQCQRCEVRMTLASVTHGPNGRDYRTFECAKCDHAETIIADDPLKSAKSGWLDSELKPPE